MTAHRPSRVLAAALACALFTASCGDSASSGSTKENPTDPPVEPPTEPQEPTDPGETDGDRAFYILPPGNYGGLPVGSHSLDQLPLYDGLTPLRGNVTDDDIEEFFLPQNLAPIGETTVIDTGRAGLTLEYDEWGIPHITGETREDVAFGAGWVTVRDRELLIAFGRGPARAAVIDIPGVNAFSLVTSATPFVPSAAAEQMVTDQVERIRTTLPEGEEIISDAQAYADGANAYLLAHPEVALEPFTVNDVIATTAFIGSIFGAGGGGEAQNAEFLSQLQNRLGADQGRAVWDDLMQTNDPEAPTTIEEVFDYGTFTGGEVSGSVVIDEGSIISLDPRNPEPGAGPGLSDVGFFDAAGDPPSRNASNWLTVRPEASASGNSLAVMGPQLGYYYPEIVMQIHLETPEWEAQGAAVPGLAHYILIGRTENYAWSLTSANQDVRDVFVETLCDPGGGTATRETGSYMHNGQCIPFEIFDAGTIGGTPIVYPVSVHGPVIGTATVAGEPVALTRRRSTFGRDGFNLAALKDMTEGDARTPEAFFQAANQFGFTFNWGYANRDGIAYFASGLLPVRAQGLDRRLPTIGTGAYEWNGFISQAEHPHATGHPTGRLLNWNNQAAPGWMHGDTTLFGSHHRVELFDQWPEAPELSDVVSIMNRAATEDTRSPVWAVVTEMLAGGEPPSDLSGAVIDILEEWLADDAPLLDADEDGFYDAPGAMIAGELWGPVETAVLAPVLQPLFDDGIGLRGIDETSIVDKDLRTLLGRPVEGPFQTAYCGAGDIEACRVDLWSAIDARVAELADEFGSDPTQWRREGRRSGFTPGLIPDDFRSTNRPTYQQVLEFARNAS